MDQIRAALAITGILPIALAVGGAVLAFRPKHRFAGIALVAAGVVWALGAFLLAKRELDVHATVTAEDPVITYH